jgi:hypothetical protein
MIFRRERQVVRASVDARTGRLRSEHEGPIVARRRGWFGVRGGVRNEAGPCSGWWNSERLRDPVDRGKPTFDHACVSTDLRS